MDAQRSFQRQDQMFNLLPKSHAGKTQWPVTPLKGNAASQSLNVSEKDLRTRDGKHLSPAPRWAYSGPAHLREKAH